MIKVHSLLTQRLPTKGGESCRGITVANGIDRMAYQRRQGVSKFPNSPPTSAIRLPGRTWKPFAAPDGLRIVSQSLLNLRPVLKSTQNKRWQNLGCTIRIRDVHRSTSVLCLATRNPG